MDVGRRRKSTGPRIGVVAGSVWESRMKLDEFKVFNGETEECCISNNKNKNKKNCNDDNNSVGNEKELLSAPTSNDLIGAIVPIVVQEMDKKVNSRAKQSSFPVSSTSGKRKTWKSESFEGSPFQIARQRSEMTKNLDEQCKELSGDGNVNKRSPVLKKTRSELIKEKELSVSAVDGIEKKTHPNQIIKSRSSGNAVIEKNVKSDDNSAESKKNLEDSNDNCKVFDKISEEEKEKVIASNVVLLLQNHHHQDEDDLDLDLDDEFAEASDDKLEIEIQEKSLVVIDEQKNPEKFVHSHETPPSIVVKKKQQSAPTPTKTKSSKQANLLIVRNLGFIIH